MIASGMVSFLLPELIPKSYLNCSALSRPTLRLSLIALVKECPPNSILRFKTGIFFLTTDISVFDIPISTIKETLFSSKAKERIKEKISVSRLDKLTPVFLKILIYFSIIFFGDPVKKTFKFSFFLSSSITCQSKVMSSREVGITFLASHSTAESRLFLSTLDKLITEEKTAEVGKVAIALTPLKFPSL